MSVYPWTKQHLTWHINQKWLKTFSFWHIWLPNVLRTTTTCTFSTSNRYPFVKKGVRTPGVLYVFTSKCALHHNGVHFFNFTTSNSGPEMVCFVHFDFQMCFPPPWLAFFFNISTFKSPPNLTCFDTFYFQMCFAPKRCVTFHLSSGQLHPHPPLWRAYFSTLRSHKTLEKTQCFATFLPFCAPASSLFWLSPSLVFSLLTFSTSEFLPGSASSWLCLSSVRIVGSFTFRLPSVILHNNTNCTLSFVSIGQ